VPIGHLHKVRLQMPLFMFVLPARLLFHVRKGKPHPLAFWHGSNFRLATHVRVPATAGDHTWLADSRTGRKKTGEQFFGSPWLPVLEHSPWIPRRTERNEAH